MTFYQHVLKQVFADGLNEFVKTVDEALSMWTISLTDNEIEKPRLCHTLRAKH